MKFSKYIVPIYTNDEFSGTGFIIEGLLITANHVVRNKINSYFIFDGHRYNIDVKYLIAMECLSENVGNYAYDLFVSRTDIEDSDLTLSEDYDRTACCQYYGYSYDEENKIISIDEASDIKISRDEALTYYFGQNIPIHNCISCYCNLKPGNSGGPLFQGLKIIGMLLRGDIYHGKCVECKFLKASYIIDAIGRMKGNHIDYNCNSQEECFQQ